MLHSTILISGLYASWVHPISNQITVLISLQVFSLKDNNSLEMELIGKAPGLILKIRSKKSEVLDPPPWADLMECGCIMRLESMTLERQKGSFLSDWAASSSFAWTLTRMDGYASVSCWTLKCEHKNDLVLIYLVTLIKSCQSYSMLMSGNCVFSSWINQHWYKCCLIRLVLCNMFRESCGETPRMSQSESLRVHWYIHKYLCFHVWRQ